ncbi:MAG: recombinase family protein [Gemmatimonadota bacterium]
MPEKIPCNALRELIPSALTAGCYVRTGFQQGTLTRQESLDAQIHICEQLAREEGRQISANHEYLFVDADAGARDPNRPGLSRLLELVRDGRAPFDRVYVSGPDRILRSPDPRDMYELCADLHAHGVKLCW